MIRRLPLFPRRPDHPVRTDHQHPPISDPRLEESRELFMRAPASRLRLGLIADIGGTKHSHCVDHPEWDRAGAGAGTEILPNG
mgnify:CR=1 FL=1